MWRCNCGGYTPARLHQWSGHRPSQRARSLRCSSRRPNCRARRRRLSRIREPQTSRSRHLRSTGHPSQWPRLSSHGRGTTLLEPHRRQVILHRNSPHTPSHRQSGRGICRGFSYPDGRRMSNRFSSCYQTGSR